MLTCRRKPRAGSDEQLIGDFYASCMDEAAIEKAGITPLNPYFSANQQALKRPKICSVEIAMMHNIGNSRFVRIWRGRGREKQFDEYRQRRTRRFEFAEPRFLFERRCQNRRKRAANFVNM